MVSFITFSTPIFIIGVMLQLILAYQLERWTGVKVFYVAGMTSSGYAELGRGLIRVAVAGTAGRRGSAPHAAGDFYSGDLDGRLLPLPACLDAGGHA
jgi:ABC-type dipeptide/oligopeptide/nickel transport system permease component